MDRVEVIKKGLSAKFYDVADRSIDSITDNKLKRASAPQLIMTAAVATDKARLIEGKATSRTEYVDASDKEIQDEINKLERELEDMGATGEVVDAGATSDSGTSAMITSTQP